MSERRKLVIPKDVADMLRSETVDCDYIDGEFVAMEKPYIHISKKHLGSARWEQKYSVVFSHDGSFWSWDVREGSTEYQEDRDLFREEYRTATEVFPKTVETVVYE